MRFCREGVVLAGAIFVKFSVDGFAEGVTELWGFQVEGVVFPQNFQQPPAAKLCVGPQKFSKCNVLEVLLSPCHPNPPVRRGNQGEGAANAEKYRDTLQ